MPALMWDGATGTETGFHESGYPWIGVATVQFKTATTLVAEVAWKRADNEVACQFAPRGLPRQAISRGKVARGVRRTPTSPVGRVLIKSAFPLYITNIVLGWRSAI